MDFCARKFRRFRPGSNPRSWVPDASMLTTRPPKPLKIAAFIVSIFVELIVTLCSFVEIRCTKLYLNRKLKKNTHILYRPSFIDARKWSVKKLRIAQWHYVQFSCTMLHQNQWRDMESGLRVEIIVPPQLQFDCHWSDCHDVRFWATTFCKKPRIPYFMNIRQTVWSPITGHRQVADWSDLHVRRSCFVS
jgi:hypothetical protein